MKRLTRDRSGARTSGEAWLTSVGAPASPCQRLGGILSIRRTQAQLMSQPEAMQALEWDSRPDLERSLSWQAPSMSRTGNRQAFVQQRIAMVEDVVGAERYLEGASSSGRCTMPTGPARRVTRRRPMVCIYAAPSIRAAWSCSNLDESRYVERWRALNCCSGARFSH